MAGGADELRLSLIAPPPALRRGYAVAGAVIMVLSGAAFGGLAGERLGLDGWVIALCAAAGAGLAALYTWRLLRRLGPPREPAEVVIRQDALLLPRSPRDTRQDEVRFSDVIDFELRGTEQDLRLLIGTDRRDYVYRARDFENPDAIWLLERTLRRALSLDPDGPTRAAEMQQRRIVGKAAMQRRPLATWTLAGLIGLVYAIQYLGGALSDDTFESAEAMLRLGANSRALIDQGQWFRLFTANFLHGGAVHLYMNGLALLWLGAVIERLLGPARLVVIYLVSALGGAAASVVIPRGLYAVGASTAIFGLLGALGALHLRVGKQLPLGFRQSRRWWILIIVINGALPLLVPIIDISGHIGGALAGVGVGLLLFARTPRLEPGKPAGWGVRATAVALCVAFAGAFAWAVQWGTQPDAGERALATVVAEAESPEALNAMAWQIAVDPAASESELTLAARLAERALALSEQPELMDTLATVRYRLGDYDAAIALERRAIAAKPQPFYYAQLARFLDARLEKEGPIGSTEGVTVKRAGDDLLLEAPQASAVDVLVGPAGRPVGLLRLRFEGETRTAAPAGLPAAELRVASVQAIEGGEVQAEYHPRDPEIEGLP